MWNPIKIYKLTKVIWKRGEDYNHYDEDLDIAAADVAREINSQMLFPSNLLVVTKLRSTPRGRDVMWGRNDKSIQYQYEKILPVITNKEIMEKYAPNTVGGHYQHLIKQWSFDELWDRRFQQDVNNGFQGWIDEVRSNISRHIFLAHDFMHVLFRYDTSQLGEACVQELQYVMSRHWGARYLSHVMALKNCYKYKSWEPFRIVREAHKIANGVKDEFWYLNPLEILDMDVDDVRKKYNIGVPVKFLKFAMQNRESFRLDSIHPEYNDVKLNFATAQSI